MDILDTLSVQLGIDADLAKTIAGAALGQVKDALPEGHANDLATAIPELGGWQEFAASALKNGASAASGGEGGIGGLLGGLTQGAGGGLAGALAGALGGAEAQQSVQLVGLLGQLGLPADKAALIGPIALDFLKERTSPELLSSILEYAPMLSQLAGGDSAANLGDLAGKLFGR